MADRLRAAVIAPSRLLPSARRLAAALAVSAAMATAAHAQAQDSYTLGDILTSLQQAAVTVNFATANANANRILDSLATLFRDTRATGLTVDELAAAITQQRADLPGVARWEPERYGLLGQSWFPSALVGLAQIANVSLESVLSATLSPDSVSRILAPVDSLGRAVRRVAQAGNQEKLRRYEIKYGPDSPRLNLAEVALNYGAQLWIPGFRPSKDGWPSPNELVAAYRTTELTATQPEGDRLKPHLVSAAQFGLRRYVYKPGWGTGGRLARTLRPREWSGGAFLMGPRDAPLVRAWGSDSRAGVFFGWGTLHLGYVFGRHQRLVLGNAKQIVPYVF